MTHNIKPLRYYLWIDNNYIDIWLYDPNSNKEKKVWTKDDKDIDDTNSMNTNWVPRF